MLIYAFFTADIVTRHSRKNTGVIGNINNAFVGHDSVTVSQHAQYQDPETEAAK